MKRLQRSSSQLLAAALTFVGAVLLVFPLAAQMAAVLPAQNGGIPESDFADIVEESAFLVADNGVFQPVRHYELAQWVGDSVAAEAMLCGTDAACLSAGLYVAGIDFVLTVGAEPSGARVEVVYTLYRMEDSAMVARETASLANSRDFAALAGPANLALSRSAGPPVALPGPAPAQPIAVQPVPYAPITSYAPPEPVRSRSQRGPLGTAGIATAGGGAALLLGGVFLAFSADDVLQQIQSTPHPASEVEDLQKKGRSRQTMANVLLAAGGVLSATGVTLVIVDSTGRERSAQLDLGATPRGAFARLRF